ncbi:RNA ligase RtcB family protein [Wukongibacter baidiensis]|uniref:RNA ligase RtcB family protein n=1 Tax=Wukongibacter baidiensis TaxID=1723361 RepID=UPI003D7F7833
MNKRVKIVRSEKSWIESNAVDQLKKASELRGIIRAVGLPDLHVGKTPVGASYMTKEIIYPHLIGNDIGCGMALFSTGIKKNKFKTHKILKKLERLESLGDIDIKNFIEDVKFPFKEKLGTIGSGNHFAEIQEIDTVYNKEALDDIGIDDKNIFLLVHSGSRSYGEQILRECIDKHSCQRGLEVSSEGFNEYLTKHNMAMEYGALNRELIAYRFLNAINGRDSNKLLDSTHNSITEKVINGESYYIHRKGAAPSDVGYVVVAGSRGTKSYIVEPTDNLIEYVFSVSHGAGRKWSRFGCKEKLQKIYSKKAIRQSNISSNNLIYKEKSVLFEEAPEAYKNIERVIEDMLEEKMIKLVASLNPLITYKV